MLTKLEKLSTDLRTLPWKSERLSTVNNKLTLTKPKNNNKTLKVENRLRIKRRKNENHIYL